MITTREDEETIVFGLQLLKSVLPAGAFYGRGTAKGPVLANDVFNPQIIYRVGFFFLSPPNLTKSQAPYKFLWLEHFRRGQFLYIAWDCVKIWGGGGKKEPPYIIE